jgi:hypothetical protein
VHFAKYLSGKSASIYITRPTSRYVTFGCGEQVVLVPGTFSTAHAILWEYCLSLIYVTLVILLSILAESVHLVVPTRGLTPLLIAAHLVL